MSEIDLTQFEGHTPAPRLQGRRGMSEDYPMDKKAADIFDCDFNFYTMMKTKPLLDRLEWAAFKMCQRGHHEDFASNTMTEAKVRIEALEAALRPFAELGEVWLPEDDKDDSIWVTCPDDTPVNNLTNFGFNFGHFRAAARAALAGEKKDG